VLDFAPAISAHKKSGLKLARVLAALSFAKENKHMEKQKDKIPLFKTWNQWYVFVVLFLVLLIFLFYRLTKHFS